MRLCFCSFCLLVIFSGIDAYSQKFSFYKEDLKFYLDTNSFTVDGLYYFSNSDSMKINRLIFYPFLQDASLGNIDTVFVYDSTRKETIHSSRIKDNSGISFPLSMEGYGFRKIKIYYVQHLKGNSAKYILKTTQNWGKPLETADYSLTVPRYIKIDSLSYSADKVIAFETDSIYYWSRKNFLPKEDFIIKFRY